MKFVLKHDLVFQIIRTKYKVLSNVRHIYWKNKDALEVCDIRHQSEERKHFGIKSYL